LPEHCYVTKEVTDKLKEKDATIYTHDSRQCITIVPNIKGNYRITIIFEGPNQVEFDKKKAEPQPIIFNIPEEKKMIFVETPK
jgi:hypothetical protein